MFCILQKLRGLLNEKIKGELSEDRLDELRQTGQDVRRHIVAVLRDSTIDINTALLELGSGPVMEESTQQRI